MLDWVADIICSEPDPITTLKLCCGAGPYSVGSGLGGPAQASAPDVKVVFRVFFILFVANLRTSHMYRLVIFKTKYLN